MKVSELIKILENKLNKYGDLDVHILSTGIDTSYDEIYEYEYENNLEEENIQTIKFEDCNQIYEYILITT